MGGADEAAGATGGALVGVSLGVSVGLGDSVGEGDSVGDGSSVGVARPSGEGRFPADYICEAVDQTRGWFDMRAQPAPAAGRDGVGEGRPRPG